MMIHRDRKPPARARDTGAPGTAEDGAAPSDREAGEGGGSTSSAKRPPGRPPGRRPIAARHTVRLDEARHGALARMATIHGRSVHSLILEAIDDLLRKRDGLGMA